MYAQAEDRRVFSVSNLSESGEKTFRQPNFSNRIAKNL